MGGSGHDGKATTKPSESENSRVPAICSVASVLKVAGGVGSAESAESSHRQNNGDQLQLPELARARRTSAIVPGAYKIRLRRPSFFFSSQMSYRRSLESRFKPDRCLSRSFAASLRAHDCLRTTYHLVTVWTPLRRVKAQI